MVQFDQYSSYNNHSQEPTTYTIVKVISSGSYGVVYEGRNNTSGEIVAIKHELHGMSESTKQEVAFLSCLPPHPSIVEYKGLIHEGDGRVYVVMEHMQTDLRRFMEAKRGSTLTQSEVKLVMKQILEGIDFLHDLDVMHRDLKPANILVNVKDTTRLKICDFGLSRIFESGLGSFTPGVGTLWYRAPEILLGGGTYTKAIDMWSIGCIMAELVSNEVLFPGDSELNQFRLIYNTPIRRATSLSASGYDLLQRLLTVDPTMRITAKDALYHRWFNEFYGLTP